MPTLLLTTFIGVALLQLVPGDPAVAILGDYATPERIAEVRRLLGLDQPLWMQYWEWLRHAVTGDLGSSFFTLEPVAQAVARTFPVTAQIVVGALLVSAVTGLPLGVVAALRHGGRLDALLTLASTTGIAMPNFWLAMMMISVLALGLGWLPATGFVSPQDNLLESLKFTLMPAIALGASGAAEVARQMRARLIEVLESEYIRTARAMGLGPGVTLRYALKNAALPVLTVFGLLVGRMLGGTVVVETVFAIPGSGSLAVTAILQRDFPVIRGVVVVMALVVVATNLLVDLLYRAVDPRVRA